MLFTSHKFMRLISTLLCLIFIVSSITFLPLTRTGNIQKAEAQFNPLSLLNGGADPVVVIGGTGTIQETLSAASNAVVAGVQEAFYIKEFTMDGIFNGLAKMVLKSMTQSILTWINSGFQGSPAFVTDLKQFMLDRADQVAGDFIYNDPSLNFLCSPFQLDVKIALATNYQNQEHEGFASQAQCTLSDVTDNVEGFLNGAFSEGGWQGWFEMTQNPVNTPTGAYLAARDEMYARIVDDEGNTIQELNWGNGFLSFKVCTDAQRANGNTQNCDITTPGAVIAEQINTSLGAGQEALIQADEIDEIIGALFAQLAQQAITGINGLLGLGASSFSQNSFGANRDKSFLDELQNENPTQGGGSFGSPFQRSIKLEEENVALQTVIVETIDATQDALDRATEQYGECFTVTMPNSLITLRDGAQTQVLISSSTIGILTNLDREYTTTNNPSIQLEAVQTYNQMTSEGLLVQAIDNARLELFIQNELPPMIQSLEDEVDTAIRACEL